MSRQHPIIAVTGSSGAGLSTIRHAFKFIFERLNIKPAIVHGDGFRRYTDRQFAALLDEARSSGRKFPGSGPSAIISRSWNRFSGPMANAAAGFIASMRTLPSTARNWG